MKQGKGEQSFAKRVHWSYPTPSSNNTRDDSTHGHHQMVNTEIRLVIFFAAKDGEALYSQQKQDWELTVAQMEKRLPTKWETQVRSLGWEDPLEKEMATHSSTLA